MFTAYPNNFIKETCPPIHLLFRGGGGGVGGWKALHLLKCACIQISALLMENVCKRALGLMQALGYWVGDSPSFSFLLNIFQPFYLLNLKNTHEDICN